VRVAVVAEYYPRAADPVLGVWAHRQALAARDAGADVRVFVLHRPVPSRAALRERSRLLEPLRQPLHARLDGIEVTYVPFLAPPRPRTYAEIGVETGQSLRLVDPGTRALGVDPEPKIAFELPPNAQVFAQTSDDFFARSDLDALLGGQPIELALIDGMHHFENAFSRRF